jgi:hypothetical protein
VLLVRIAREFFGGLNWSIAIIVLLSNPCLFCTI